MSHFWGSVLRSQTAPFRRFMPKKKAKNGQPPSFSGRDRRCPWGTWGGVGRPTHPVPPWIQPVKNILMSMLDLPLRPTYQHLGPFHLIFGALNFHQTKCYCDSFTTCETSGPFTGEYIFKLESVEKLRVFWGNPANADSWREPNLFQKKDKNETKGRRDLTLGARLGGPMGGTFLFRGGLNGHPHRASWRIPCRMLPAGLQLTKNSSSD